MSQEQRSAQQPFSFDTEARAADFTGLARQLAAFSERELGAFGLFKRVALKTLENGEELKQEVAPSPRPGAALTAFQFPEIDYNPDYADSTQRRQILLRLDRIATSSEVVSETPWLTVHPMEIGEDECLIDTAEQAFMRLPLEAIVGRRNDRESERFFDTMLTPRYMEARQVLVEEQDDYIDWLGKAATSVGIASNFYVAPDNAWFLNHAALFHEQ